jgi:hypothetical protein
MSNLEKAAAAAVASWERDGANYNTFCQRMDALRDALAAHRQAEPVAETVPVQQAWEWAGGNPGIRATVEDLRIALDGLDRVCDQADLAQQTEPVRYWQWACSVCGVGADGKVMGYVCGSSDCPMQVRSGT